MSPEGIHDGRDAAASFDPLRPLLTRVAYRMLGSVADAEDVVQDAFVRWMGTDRAAVREPEAFLRRTVTRLCPVCLAISLMLNSSLNKSRNVRNSSISIIHMTPGFQSRELAGGQFYPATIGHF